MMFGPVFMGAGHTHVGMCAGLLDADHASSWALGQQVVRPPKRFWRTVIQPVMLHCIALAVGMQRDGSIAKLKPRLLVGG